MQDRTETNFAADYLHHLADLLPKLDPDAVQKAVDWTAEARDAGRTVYSCGNGGSAAIASQMVVDIVKGAVREGKPRPKMMCLGDSIATITAYANDMSYDDVFVEPLRNFAARDDVLIAISGSGNSRNVLKAVEYANSIGCRTIGLTSADGGSLRETAHLPLLVPSRHMGRLEDCFFVMTHILSYALIEGVV